MYLNKLNAENDNHTCQTVVFLKYDGHEKAHRFVMKCQTWVQIPAYLLQPT